MFVQFSLNAVAVGESQEDFATFFISAHVVIFSIHTGLEKPRTYEQCGCPGYDDNTEAPIVCSVIKAALVNIGVNHQWILLFQKWGTV